MTMGAASIAVALFSIPTFAAQTNVDFPDRYWPAFPAPARLLVSESHNGLGQAEGVLLNTLSGIVAAYRPAGEAIWIGVTNAPSYDEWFKRFRGRNKVETDETIYGVWDLLERYRANGLVKGYILYERDQSERPLYEGKSDNESVNVATALSNPLRSVAVEAAIEDRARQAGLECLLDVRDKDERWVWERYGDRFIRTVLGRQDPKSFVNRDAIVAMRAMLVSGTNALYDEVLGAFEAGSPLLGWGIGMEDAQTGPASRYACFQTATNWCVDLPVLSSGRTGLDYEFVPFPDPGDADPKDDEDARYVSFLLTDGDNVQWLMLNFCVGGPGQEANQYWACAERGKMPFGWTIPAMDLLQLCPYTLDYLRGTRTSKDDFVLLSGGYYYPDWFGDKRPETDLLARHARRIGRYMDACGLKTLMVNVQDWDCPAALRAYETYAREIPNLEGLFVIQYAPYTGGEGAIRWVRRRDNAEIPVVTARNALWCGRGDDPREGAPGKVATILNAWAERPAEGPEDRFAWVTVHCWSWFRDPGKGAEEVEQNVPDSPDIARGYRPALWCGDRLSPAMRIVTPLGLVRRLRVERARSDTRR